MNVVFLTGDHPRHAQLAQSVAASGHLAGLVIETREAFVPSAPERLAPETRALFDLHFARRHASESRHFGASLPDVPRLDVSIDTLNAPATADFINSLRPDLILSYGVHKLTPETLGRIACARKWNIHGGLSPWYRGVTTHFWPSYMLEPQMTGMTVHQLTQDIDGGDVIHQTQATLVRGDGLHDLACRAVQSLCDDLPELLDLAGRGADSPARRQGTTGRIWRSVDWQPAHLHLIYETHGDRIVDAYLDGRFAVRDPVLVRQF
ncbi:formyl transferase [Methylobacterium sp. J-026]|uniref:formyl transferase n=1 Tax=Methylobacterium sp. J-026 TaxID=2836624 RepID=UPI001FB991A0|nr:formyl transferase [Methylobacterium sp. J-026]MCJ2136353.1 formyl transferase [Methylobacterium sp. J-026]